MKNDIRELLEDLGMDEDFIVQFEAAEMVKLAKWCKALYEAGEAMYDELCMYGYGKDAVNALEEWKQARKLEVADDTDTKNT